MSGNDYFTNELNIRLLLLFNIKSCLTSDLVRISITPGFCPPLSSGVCLNSCL